MKLKKLTALFLIVTFIFLLIPINKENHKVNADTAITTGYENFVQSYYDNLKFNFGYNHVGSCGYIALGMLLSYYDTFHDDAIIPENYDVNSVSTGNNMVLRQNSPGVKCDFIYPPDDISNEELEEFYEQALLSSNYIDKIFAEENESLHAKLITIGVNELSYYQDRKLGLYATQLDNILNYYLTNFLNFSSSDFSITIKLPEDGYSNTQLRAFVIDEIKNGKPVLVGIHRPFTTNRHFVIAYDYDEDTDNIFCHMGEDNPDGSEYIPRDILETHYDYEANGWTSYMGALTLDWNTPHSCSNNYVVQTKDEDGNVISTNTYCYQHKDIITYDHRCDKYEYTIQDWNSEYHQKICHCTNTKLEAHVYDSNRRCTICNHCDHEYSYSYVNDTTCRATCYNCMFTKTQSHVFIIGNLNYCISCKATINSGFGAIIHQGIINLVSLNGSYVLANGNIVLVPEDLQAYYNGTLVFYNKNELPEVA